MVMHEMTRLLEESVGNRELLIKLARASDLDALVRVARQEGYLVDAEDLARVLRPREEELAVPALPTSPRRSELLGH